ncbi:GNAT family N-acetyltransferase [Streptomyces sp. NPDC102364]|uniref:GNAT family N-acetyltransferase n=1 Tax=Streptomyces sp. NPDC102364 TaxID=3366161 RepID=UPI00380F177B
MAERGYSPWPQTPSDVASRADMPECPLYVLEKDGIAVGCTILLDKPGTAVFSPAERAEPCFVLTSSVTDPVFAGQNLGEKIAQWALERAAAEGKKYVRRVTHEERLMMYYKRQGFDVVRTAERHGRTIWGMQAEAN